MKKYYVYRFLNSENEIIYVGKTSNLQNRMKQHFSDHNGHLPKDCYDNVVKIEYIELNHPIDMTIYELYYISQYKPKYNTNDILYDNKSDIANITEREWIHSVFVEEYKTTYKDLKLLNLDVFVNKYMLEDNSKLVLDYLGDKSASLKEFYKVLKSFAIIGKVGDEFRGYTDYSINRFFKDNDIKYRLKFYKEKFDIPRSRKYRFYVLTKIN